jgi:hypothetical protein
MLFPLHGDEVMVVPVTVSRMRTKARAVQELQVQEWIMIYTENELQGIDLDMHRTEVVLTDKEVVDKTSIYSVFHTFDVSQTNIDTEAD